LRYVLHTVEAIAPVEDAGHVGQPRNGGSAFTEVEKNANVVDCHGLPVVLPELLLILQLAGRDAKIYAGHGYFPFLFMGVLPEQLVHRDAVQARKLQKRCDAGMGLAGFPESHGALTDAEQLRKLMLC
jgi:hypothetical protein